VCWLSDSVRLKSNAVRYRIAIDMSLASTQVMIVRLHQILAVLAFKFIRDIEVWSEVDGTIP